jgi:WD40 repeat protein
VIYGANLRLIDVLSGRYKAALWPERSVSGRGLFVLGPVNFSSDGETLAVSSRPKLVLGDVTTGKVRVEIPFFQGKAFQFGPPSHVFAPDGKSFAILDEHDGGVTILESSDGRLRTRLKDRKDDVLNFRYSPDGKMLAVKTLDGRISLSETSLGLQKTSFATAPGAFPMLEFAPDGRTLATTGPDQSIRLLDVGTGRETAILRGHTGVVLSLAYSPDGRAIASGGADKSVRVWDTVTGQEVAALTGHKGDDQVGPFGDVLRLEFSPDGKTLASYGQVETVRLWSRGP